MSHSKQLESAVPPSKISGLSSGEFVGMVADDPDNKIELKTFHCQILNDHGSLKAEENRYTELPILKNLDNAIVQKNYFSIKQDIKEIITSEIRSILNTPLAEHLIIRKERY